MIMKKFLCKYGVAFGLLLNSFCYLVLRKTYVHNILAIPVYIVAITAMILGAYYSKKAYNKERKRNI